MFRQLVNVVSRSTSAAKLPSDGLRLNASKPESMLLKQCILLLVTWFDLEPFQRTRLRPMPIQQLPPLMGVCVLFQQNLCVTSDPLRKRFRQIRVSYVLREAIVLRSIDVYPLVLDLVRPVLCFFFFVPPCPIRPPRREFGSVLSETRRLRRCCLFSDYHHRHRHHLAALWPHAHRGPADPNRQTKMPVGGWLRLFRSSVSPDQRYLASISPRRPCAWPGVCVSGVPSLWPLCVLFGCAPP